MEKPRSSLDVAKEKKISPNEVKSDKAIELKGSVTAKRNIAGEFVNNLLNEKDGTSRGSYIVDKVVIPAAKKTLFDVIKNITNGFLGAIEVALYGTRSPSIQQSPTMTRYSYTNYTNPQPLNIGMTPTRDLGNLQFDYLEDAQRVREQLNDIIQASSSHVATIVDLCEAINMPSEYTDADYGWTTVANSAITPLSNGKYWLRLPKPIYVGRRNPY